MQARHGEVGGVGTGQAGLARRGVLRIRTVRQVAHGVVGSVGQGSARISWWGEARSAAKWTRWDRRGMARTGRLGEPWSGLGG